jgi:hypothetical protein
MVAGKLLDLVRRFCFRGADGAVRDADVAMQGSHTGRRLSRHVGGLPLQNGAGLAQSIIDQAEILAIGATQPVLHLHPMRHGSTGRIRGRRFTATSTCWSIFDATTERNCIMPTHRPGNGLAQPADEEIKKHGDQLEKQVKDAAGKPLPEKESDTGKQEPVEQGRPPPRP